MNNDDVLNYLNKREIKPTPNRILVAKELMNASSPKSLADLESSLSTVDKASIFRVLELFAEKDMIHVLQDGSRSLKYELCKSPHHSAADQHIHFYCQKCKNVYCFEDIPIPQISVPENFDVKSANFMLIGTCEKCKNKEKHKHMHQNCLKDDM